MENEKLIDIIGTLEDSLDCLKAWSELENNWRENEAQVKGFTRDVKSIKRELLRIIELIDNEL